MLYAVCLLAWADDGRTGRYTRTMIAMNALPRDDDEWAYLSDADLLDMYHTGGRPGHRPTVPYPKLPTLYPPGTDGKKAVMYKRRTAVPPQQLHHPCDARWQDDVRTLRYLARLRALLGATQ